MYIYIYICMYIYIYREREIEIRDVWFAYPSAPTFYICQVCKFIICICRYILIYIYIY